MERLKQGFELLEKKPKAKMRAGMKGLVEERQEQITEGKEKEEFLSDLASAAAAQKVEHYEFRPMAPFGLWRKTGSVEAGHVVRRDTRVGREGRRASN